MSDGPEHIVQMANDIGNFFRTEPNRQVALDGISNHINKFWTRRMRQKLFEYVQHGGTELDELPRAALAQVTVPPPGQPATAPTSAALTAASAALASAATPAAASASAAPPATAASK